MPAPGPPARRARARLSGGARRVALVLAALVLALLGVAGVGAAPAGAHAVVVASSPAAGQVLARSPTEAWVQFSEEVSTSDDSITVLDSQGGRVDEGAPPAATRDVVRTALPPGLPDGTYVINYRVVSADGHPVSGAIVFGVGEGTQLDAAAVAGLEAGDDRAGEVAGVVARALTYLGALAAAGLAVFLAFFHDGGADRRRLGALARAAVVVGALGALATVATQAALITGRGVSAAFDASALRRALAEGLGWSTAALLVGLAVVLLSVGARRTSVAQVLAFYGGLAVAVAFPLWGHTWGSAQRWLAMGSDAVHVAAAALWFGGLVGLGVVLAGRGRPAVAAARILTRFTDAAAVSVAVLVVAGGVLATTQVGAVGELWSTTYGRLLLTKGVIVVGVLAVAAWNRWRLVPDLEADLDEAGADGDLGGVDRPSAWSLLVATVRVEAVALVAVLVVTAVLVNVTPAKTAAEAGAGVASFTAPLATGQVSLVVTPSDVGANVIHIQYVDDVGRPLDTVQQVAVELVEPAQGIGPLTTPPPTKLAPGHYIANGVQVPVAGSWDLTLVTRLSDFEQDRTTFPVEIR